jgi:hypothetical protein
LLPGSPASSTTFGKKEHAGRIAIHFSDAPGRQHLGYFRYTGTLDRKAQLEPGAAWESRITLFGQDSFNGAHGEFNPVFGEQLGDLAGREAMLPPHADFLASGHIDSSAIGLAFRHGFRKVDLVVGELMPEEVHIGRGIAETVRHNPGWQTIDKGGSQRLIATLPIAHRMEEKRFIGHAALIANDA